MSGQIKEGLYSWFQRERERERRQNLIGGSVKVKTHFWSLIFTTKLVLVPIF